MHYILEILIDSLAVLRQDTKTAVCYLHFGICTGLNKVPQTHVHRECDLVLEAESLQM